MESDRHFWWRIRIRYWWEEVRYFVAVMLVPIRWLFNWWEK